MKVLRSATEIELARSELVRRGVSALRPSHRIGRFLIDRGWYPFRHLGDYKKSWDVLQTLTFIESHLSKSASILDLGCFGSELPATLSRTGFTNLHGVDLDPRLGDAEAVPNVHFTRGDYFQAPYRSTTFDALTAISVIEHGYDPDRLIHEASRLLKPGGFFILSFDYWPEKLDTGEQRLFGMPWAILSKDDVAKLVSVAREVGSLVEVESDRSSASPAPVISFSGRRYTFAWMVLQKLRP
jgi:SAM-dependent methyltransferase